MKYMNRLVAIGLISIAGGMSFQQPVHAQAADTRVAVTFKKEDQVPKPDEENQFLDQLDAENVEKKQAGFLPSTASDVKTGKRLPITGDDYNEVLAQLGWLALFSVIFFFLMTRKKGEEDNEEV